MRRSLIIALSLLAVIVMAAYEGETVPASTAVHDLAQPDGMTLPAVLWGDERLNGRETIDGYSLVKDPVSGFWFYAVHGSDGGLVSSGRRAGRDERPEGLEKHLRPTGEAFERMLRKRQKNQRSPMQGPVHGPAVPKEDVP